MKIRIDKVAWSGVAAEALFPVMGDDAELLQREVERGTSELYRVGESGWLISRLEGDRLIVCCYIGTNLAELARYIYTAAQRAGCTSVQFHTDRPGLQRLLKNFGAVCTGRYYVYKIDVIQ